MFIWVHDWFEVFTIKHYFVIASWQVLITRYTFFLNILKRTVLKQNVEPLNNTNALIIDDFQLNIAKQILSQLYVIIVYIILCKTILISIKCWNVHSLFNSDSWISGESRIDISNIWTLWSQKTAVDVNWHPMFIIAS